MNFSKRKDSKKYRKILIHGYTSCKQTASLTDTENVFRSCVTYDGSNTNNVIVRLVTELYISTLSVVCDFRFPRIFCFLNPSHLAVKCHKLYMTKYGGCFEFFTFLHLALW